LSIGKRQATRRILATGVLAASLIGLGAPAYADSSVDPANEVEATSSVTFAEGKTEGAAESIPQAYKNSLTQESEAAKDAFVDKVAQESGLYYDTEALDYLKLELDPEAAASAEVDEVELVVPKDFHVNEVTLEESTAEENDGEKRNSLTAGIKGSVTIDPADVALPDGPGFAEFKSAGSGQYILKTRVGEMLATWIKAKLDTDGESTKDYWQYGRKARVTTKNVSGVDWKINSFGIGSKPGTALKNWVDWAPSTGEHTGDCNTKPVTLTAGYKGVAGIEMAFQDCDKYTGYMVSDNPGDFSVRWDKGFWRTSDPRETAFTWVAASAQGRTVTMDDLQWVKFEEGVSSDLTVETILCQNTNAGKNC
jgi:hypothetical protein